MRQVRIKELAAIADARWASQTSYLDSPDKQQPVPAIGMKDPGGYAGPTESARNKGVQSAVGSQPVVAGSEVSESRENEGFAGAGEIKEPPWKVAPTGTGEEWQPKAWKPGPKRKK